jgi:hypothetical protein
MPLRTIPQFCKEEGLTRYQVDLLVREGRIEHVQVGSRKMIPDGAYQRFIADNTVKACRVETKVLVSASSTSGEPSTSSGLKMVAAGSAARARQTAERLKSLSRTSSISASVRTDHASLTKFS